MYLLKDKSKPTTKKICNNKKVFKEALTQNFEPPTIDENTGLSQAYNQLKTKLQEMLDKTAPERTFKVFDKPKQPYFNKYVWDQRKTVKNKERVQKNSGRITTGWLIKKRETGTTNYSNYKKSNA